MFEKYGWGLVVTVAGLMVGPAAKAADDQVYVAKQLDGGSAYVDLGGVSYGGYGGTENWELGTSVNKNFSFGRITGRAHQVIVPSKRLCVDTVFWGRKCWNTPAVTADTRSGVKMDGSVGAYAHVGTDFAWRSGGFEAQLAAGLAGEVVLPEVTYGYDSFRPAAFVDWDNSSQLDVTLPGVEFDPYFGVGAHFDARVTGAVPGLGVHGFDMPDIDFDLPRLGFDLPEFGLPTIDSPFDFNNNRDDVAKEYKIHAGATEVASIQRLRVFNPKFIDEVNAKKDAFLSLKADLDEAVTLLTEGATREQARAMAGTLADWVEAGQKKAAPETGLNMLLQRGDERSVFRAQLEAGLQEAADTAAGDTKAKLENTRARLGTILSGFDEDMFTQHVQTQSSISANRIAGKVRWDMVDFDLDLDGLASLVAPIKTQVVVGRKFGPLGNLLASVDVVDLKMGPKFGLVADFSTEWKESGFSWEATRDLVVKNNSGITVANSFKTNDGSNTVVQLLGSDQVGFNVRLDGLEEHSQFGLDLIVSDLGTLEVEALGDFDMRFTSGLGRRINRMLPRWNDAVFAGKFPLTEFEFTIDLFDTSSNRNIDLNLDLGSTILTPQHRPVVPLLLDKQEATVYNKPDNPADSGDFAPVDQQARDVLLAAMDPTGANHGGRPSGIAKNFDQLPLRTQTINYDGNTYNLSWGLGDRLSPGDGPGSLWDNIKPDARQLVIGYRDDYRNGAETPKPMSLWVYDGVEATPGADQQLGSLKVLEGSELRLEPASQTAASASNTHRLGQRIDTRFVENDGLIRMVGETQRDLVDDTGTVWKGYFHEVGLQGVNDAGLTSLIIEGSGEIAMQGLAWLGAIRPGFGGSWEGNDTLFNLDGHRISGRHGVTDSSFAASGDRLDWMVVNTPLAGDTPNTKDAPAVVASGLIHNQGTIVATGHGSLSDFTDLVVFTPGNLVNDGWLGSEGGNLAVHAGTGIRSSGQIEALGGRVEITPDVVGTMDRGASTKRVYGPALTASLQSSGLIAARQGGMVNVLVNDFDNQGGRIEATTGGQVAIATLASSSLGDGTVLLAEGTGSSLVLGSQSVTDGASGVIGVNVFDGAHLALNGLARQHPADDTRVLFDIDNGTLELGPGVFDTRNFLLRSTGTLALRSGAAASFVHVPSQTTDIEGQRVVDLDLGRVLVDDAAHLQLELINAADSSSLGNDIHLRNNSELTRVQGSGSIGYLAQMTQLTGQLVLENGALVATGRDLAVQRGAHALAGIEMNDGSTLRTGGGLALGVGTFLRGADSRLEVGLGPVIVNGASLEVGQSNLLQAGTLFGDWEVSEVAKPDGNRIGARVDLGGKVSRIAGSLQLAGEAATFSGLESLQQVDGSLALESGNLRTIGPLLTTGRLDVNGGVMQVNGIYRSGAASYTRIGKGGGLQAQSMAISGSVYLDGGTLVAQRLDQGDNLVSEINIDETGRLSGSGDIAGKVLLQGNVSVGGSEGYSSISVNGELKVSSTPRQLPFGLLSAVQADLPVVSIDFDIGGLSDAEHDRLDIFGELTLSGSLGRSGMIKAENIHSKLGLNFSNEFRPDEASEIMLVLIDGFGSDPADTGKRTGYFDIAEVTWGNLNRQISNLRLDDLGRVLLGTYYNTRVLLDYSAGDGNDIALQFLVPEPSSLILLLSSLLALGSLRSLALRAALNRETPFQKSGKPVY